MNSDGIDLVFQTLPLSAELDCSYFPERSSILRYCFAEPSFNSFVVEQFLERGYRRSGDLFYKTECKKCRMCIPYRIPLDTFRPNSSQKRNLKFNAELRFSIGSPQPSNLKQSLYLKYIKSRHENLDKKESDESHLETMDSQMYEYINHSLEIEIYDESKLIGFGIIDIGKETISSVYNVFDPDYKKNGLGVFMILKTIEWAKNISSFKYIQLGLFIPEHPKMDYKKNFKPGEILHPLSEKWEDVQFIL
ncbi:MAG: arginyltransferase [Leptospira sp.]|nr:arginyltransferase [Leptospira sp.]NCS95331.1 arginyltransferase [Leptospira sp.]